MRQRPSTYPGHTPDEEGNELDGIRVNRSLTIPEDELRFTFSPSGGPGGQHANRSATKVELVWNVDASRALGPRQRDRLRSKLGHRIDSSGNLRVASDAQRSQLRNREAVVKRLATLVAEALIPEKKRVATRATKASRERRLTDKKRRSALKRLRRGDPD